MDLKVGVDRRISEVVVRIEGSGWEFASSIEMCPPAPICVTHTHKEEVVVFVRWLPPWIDSLCWERGNPSLFWRIHSLGDNPLRLPIAAPSSGDLSLWPLLVLTRPALVWKCFHFKRFCNIFPSWGWFSRPRLRWRQLTTKLEAGKFTVCPKLHISGPQLCWPCPSPLLPEWLVWVSVTRKCAMNPIICKLSNHTLSSKTVPVAITHQRMTRHSESEPPSPLLSFRQVSYALYYHWRGFPLPLFLTPSV